jgi:hypothetical protein
MKDSKLEAAQTEMKARQTKRKMNRRSIEQGFKQDYATRLKTRAKMRRFRAKKRREAKEAQHLAWILGQPARDARRLAKEEHRKQQEERKTAYELRVFELACNAADKLTGKPVGWTAGYAAGWADGKRYQDIQDGKDITQ